MTAGPRASGDTPLRIPLLVAYAGGLLAALAAGALHVADAHPLVLGVLVLGVAFAARQELEVGKIGISGEAFLIIVASALLGPAAALVACGSFAARYDQHAVRIFNTASIVIPAWVAGWVVTTLETSHVTAALTAAVVSPLLNALLACTFACVAYRMSFVEMARTITASMLATILVLAPIVAGIVALYYSIGPAALPLVVLPLLLVQYFHNLYVRKAQLTDELADKAQILARTNLQFAAAMVRALDQRDAYTAGHSAAVAVYTRDIAREMGFDDETVRLAHLAGLLHDIGKIGVPGRVLNKTAPLDDEEYELMKTHAAMGAEILSEVDLYAEIAVLVRYHHERIDGRGYPDQLEGEAIPAISRMISVADTYSAMTTDRPYRDGMPTEKAMSILKECRGTQLDSDFTDAFLRILVIADAGYQRGKQTDFEVEVAKHQALSEVEAEAIRVNAPTPASPAAEPVLPAATEDGELIEVELEREAA